MSALPPLVISGLPKMTPTLDRSWFTKTTVQLHREALEASFRRAWLISRAWSPICCIPMSPSISARGTSAATESTTTMSTAEDRTSWSATCSAISPLSGWQMTRPSVSTPAALAYAGSKACSASMKAAAPPAACTSARACRASVVLPLLSGPYTSTIRPTGRPPPRALSSVRAPVEKVATWAMSLSPSVTTAPFPNCRSRSFSTAESAARRGAAAPLASRSPAGSVARPRAGGRARRRRRWRRRPPADRRAPRHTGPRCGRAMWGVRGRTREAGRAPGLAPASSAVLGAGGREGGEEGRRGNERSAVLYGTILGDSTVGLKIRTNPVDVQG